MRADMTSELLTGRLLSGFPQDLVEDFDIVEVLTAMSERCVDVLDISAAAVMLDVCTVQIQLARSRHVPIGRAVRQTATRTQDHGPTANQYTIHHG